MTSYSEVLSCGWCLRYRSSQLTLESSEQNKNNAIGWYFHIVYPLVYALESSEQNKSNAIDWYFHIVYPLGYALESSEQNKNNAIGLYFHIVYPLVYTLLTLLVWHAHLLSVVATTRPAPRPAAQSPAR